MVDSPAMLRASRLANGAGSRRTPSSSPATNFSYDVLGLLPEHAAHGVEQPTAVARVGGSASGDGDLERGEARHVLGRATASDFSGRLRKVPTPEQGASTTTRL